MDLLKDREEYKFTNIIGFYFFSKFSHFFIIEKNLNTILEKLLDLGCIKKSKSPRRSLAFIVNKHSEIIRGESRMVINYKRLNNNFLASNSNYCCKYLSLMAE